MTNECATSPSQHLSTFITSLFPGFLAHGIVGTVVVGRAQVEVDGLVLAPGSDSSCVTLTRPPKLSLHP